MNKQCYRVVFNKARGIMMVVSEIARSQNKSSGNSSGQKKSSNHGESQREGSIPSFAKTALVMLCSQTIIFQQVQAATNINVPEKIGPITPVIPSVRSNEPTVDEIRRLRLATTIKNTAQNIPTSQRAALLKAKDGTPIVNIRTPNKKGLSHNTYSQFDIGNKGAILNNSRGNVNTKLAGKISGNQYLAKGSASTILNEIRSSKASHLYGDIEVAGQRANVIIANPAGIQVQGGGFINANRATLTTGAPIKDKSGNITGFNVAKGTIAFNNSKQGSLSGLRKSKDNRANYVDVYARAVDINGKIYAKQNIDIVAGNNQVSYSTGQKSKNTTAQGEKPKFAIDVNKLGGIYANSISLVGTEKGLGVNNEGTISARNYIGLDSSGNVTNKGTLQSYGLIDLNAKRDIIHNKGKVKQLKTSSTQHMPKIIKMNAGRHLIIDNESEVRNYSTSKKSNINLHANTDIQIRNKSTVTTEGSLSVDANRYLKLSNNSNTNAKKGMHLHSDKGIVVDNSKLQSSLGDITVSAGKKSDKTLANVVIQNKASLSTPKGNVNLIGEEHTELKSNSQVYKTQNLNMRAGGTALIDNAKNVNVTENINLEADKLAHIKNTKTGFNVGKDLNIKGNQTSITNSNLSANKAINVISDKKLTTLSNSSLTSKQGVVSAISANSEVKANKLNTNAKTTVLAGKNNVTAINSNITSDSVIVESQANINLNHLTTKAKNSKEIGQFKSYSKDQTSINDSNIANKGNVTIYSGNRMTVIDTDINAGKNLSLKSNDQLYSNTRKDSKVENGKNKSYTNYKVNKKQNNFTANDAISIDSRWWQTYKDTNIKGSAIELKAGSGHTFSDNLNFTATGASSELNKTKRGRNINGDIQIINTHHTKLNNHHKLNAKNDIIIQSDKRIELKNMNSKLKNINPIKAGSLQLKTLKKETLKGKDGFYNTEGTGDIHIINTEIRTNDKGDKSTVIDAANHVSVVDSHLISKGSTTIKSGDLMQLNNSTISSLGNLIVDSGGQLVTNGKRKEKTNSALQHINGSTELESEKITSIKSRWAQHHKNVTIMSGAALINSGTYLRLDSGTTIVAVSNDDLAKDKRKISDKGNETRSTLNGDLVISAKNDVTIDPKKVILFAESDINLNSRNGTLALKGYSGKNGWGSEKVVKLETQGDINLSGKNVVIEGADLITGKLITLPGGAKGIPLTKVNITATGGNVELKGVKNSFKNKVSQYKIKQIEEQIENTRLEFSKDFTPEELMLYEQEHTMLLGSWCPPASPCKPLDTEKLKKLRSNPLYNAKKSKEFVKKVAWNPELHKIVTDLESIKSSSNKASNGYEYKAVDISAGSDVNISAQKGGILMEGTDVNSERGNINIIADGNLDTFKTSVTDDKTKITTNFINNDSIRITGLADIYAQGDINTQGKVTGPNYSFHKLINQTNLKADKNINIAGKGTLDKKSNVIRISDKSVTTNNAVVLNSTNLKADGNVNIDSTAGDVLLEASEVAFLDGSKHTSVKRKWYGKKKVTTTTFFRNNRNAVTTDISAKNIKLKSDGDIKIYASELEAKNKGKIDIEAGKGLYLYAIKNKKYSETDVKSKSSWLGIRYNKDHTNDTRTELSQLPAKLIGGKAYTKSGHNTLLEGTVFDTLDKNDIKIKQGKYADKDAKLILKPIIKQVNTTHTQDKESLVWMKTVDSGNTVTTAEMPKMPSGLNFDGKVVIHVPVDQFSKEKTKAIKIIQKSDKELGKIALELANDPNYAYLKQLDANNQIDWNQVNLIQREWNYTQEGLTPAAAALIAIAVTAATSGWGAAMLPGGSGIAVAATATTPAVFTVPGLAANAAASALFTQASVTLINNQGDISKTLDDLGHSETVRNMATAALTAGLTEKLGINGWDDKTFTDKLTQNIASGVLEASVDAAVNNTDFEQALKANLRSAFVDAGTAIAFKDFVKDFDGETFADNLTHKLMAVGVGCLSAEAKQQSCDAGALGAAVGEMVGDYLVTPEIQQQINAGTLDPKIEAKILNMSQLIAGSVALVADVDVDTAAGMAVQAVENNSLTPIQSDDWTGRDVAYEVFSDKVAECKNSGQDCTQLIQQYWVEHTKNHEKLKQKCTNGGITCPTVEELLVAKLNGLKRLKDPDAKKVATLMLARDLALLNNGIRVRDRFFQNITDPILLATLVLTRGKGGAVAKGMTKQQAINIMKNAGINAGVSMSAEAAIQYYLTGDINLRDVYAIGLTGAVFGAATTQSIKIRMNQNNSGPLYLTFDGALDQSAVDRLNRTDIHVGKSKIGEAMSGSELETKIGTMRRAGKLDGDVDFVIINGPNKKKGVDLLFAVDPNKVSGLQKSFDYQWGNNNIQNTIDNHIRKAAIVPIDLRKFSNPIHRQKIIDYVNNKPKNESSKVIFMID